jgi:hypothetical protein
MPTNTISVRNIYVPSHDGKRFLVNKALDVAVPPINVVPQWTQNAEGGPSRGQ